MTVNSVVMVIDDSESDQFYVSELLDEYDETIEVVSVYDGQEALNMLAAMPLAPHVILLDLNMPLMDGFDFLEAYKNSYARHCPVFVLSSSEQAKDKEKASAYGFVHKFLVKPIQVDDLPLLFHPQ